MEDFLEAAQQAAIEGGQVLIEMQGKINPREKAPADLVTEADLASQKAIRERLLGQFPQHDFLGEEDLPGETASSSSEYTWIVDPLDGTTNYVHGLDNYCVSVGLRTGDRVVAAAVYDPVRQRCYSALAGRGAFCNQRPLRVSQVGALPSALVAASLPAQVDRDSAEVARFLDIMVRCQAIRRLGSAALNLCYVAEGKLDAYWATSVKKWDIAAGVLLVQEAGGVITGLDGSPLSLDRPQFISAATTSLHQELLAALGATC